MSAPALTADQQRFLSVLCPEGHLDIRGFHASAKGKSQGQIVSATHTDLIAQIVQDMTNGHLDIYVGVATRGSRRDGTTANCSHLHALFADLDFKEYAGGEAEARQRLAAFAIQPTMVVTSGNGLHAYWAIEPAIDLQADGPHASRRRLRALSRALGADMKSAEVARVLRVPDSLNFKYQPARPVLLDVYRDGRVPLADIDAAIPLADERDDRPASTAAPVAHDMALDARTALAAAWLARRAPAIEGQGGDTHTFSTCCAIVLGFDLPIDDAITVLAPWNARCQPPWSETDLRRKVSGALHYGTEPRGGRLLAFPHSEHGDAQAFATMFRDSVRYSFRTDQHLILDDASGTWAPDGCEQVVRCAADLMSQRFQVAMHRHDDAGKRWAQAGFSRKRLMNTIALARTVPPIGVPASDTSWDAQPFLLGVPNGVVDLRDGSLRRARPDEKITMRAAVPYDPKATAPLWERTLREIFTFDSSLDGMTPEARADALVAFFQRALGYSLTGDVREECFFLCWGTGRNGKATVLNRFHRLLGDYAENLSMAALETHKYDGRGPRPDIAKLPGKRFVTASENKKTATLDEEMVKRVTGRDPVTARHLYKPEFTFEPAFKLWLMVNNKPEGIREDDVAMWSRIKFIPFLQSFAGREDMTLKDRLNDEDAGILTWAVQGAMLWQAHGLQPPAIVTAATQEYRAETDQLAAFIASRCVTGPTRVAKAGDLLRNYQEWVADNGQEQSYNHRTLTPALVLRGFAIDTTKPKAYTWLRGIGLVTERIDQ